MTGDLRPNLDKLLYMQLWREKKNLRMRFLNNSFWNELKLASASQFFKRLFHLASP